jgi:hypothetical protein
MAKFYRLALRGKAAFGWGQARRSGGGPWTLREFVDDCLPAADSIVLQIRRLNHARSQIQKCTIELRDRSGTIIGYVKYAVDTLPSRRLEQEHDMLTRLPTGLGPIPLRFGKMGDGTALLVTPLRGRAVMARLPPAPGVLEFAKSLEVPPSLALADHPYVRAVRERVGTRLDASLADLSGRSWPLAFQHGDLVPWNIRSRGKGLAAFDWEHGIATGFPYLDLAYFILQLAALIYRWPPVKSAIYAARWLEAQPAFRLTGGEARALIRLSMCDAYYRLEDDGFGDDHPLQPWRRRIWRGPW